MKEHKFKVIYHSTVYDEYEATVTAESEEEALELLKNGQYDDREFIAPVIDQYDEKLNIQSIERL